MTGNTLEESSGHALSLLTPRLTGITVLYGNLLAREVGFYALADRLAEGERIVVLDGSNDFNSYLFSDIAQLMKADAEKLLSQVLISRAVTCHQMATLVKRSRAALEQHHSRILVALDLLFTFRDTEVSRHEAAQVLQRPLQCLRWLGAHGYYVLLLCGREPQPGFRRREFFQWVKDMADHVFRVGMTEGDQIELTTEKPPSQERRQLKIESALTYRRREQPPMRWIDG